MAKSRPAAKSGKPARKRVSKRAQPKRTVQLADGARADAFIVSRLSAQGKRHYLEALADYTPAATRLDKPLPLALIGDLAQALADHDEMRERQRLSLRQQNFQLAVALDTLLHRLRQSIATHRTLIQRSLGQERRDTYQGKKAGAVEEAHNVARAASNLTPPSSEVN